MVSTGIAATLVATLAACAPPPPPAPPLIDRLGLDGLVRAVEDGDHGDIAAILVSRDGRIVFEDYFGRNGPDSIVDMRSAGKSLTAIALGVAIDDGAIDGVESPVLPFFEDLAPFRNDGPEKRAIVLRDLLTMGSALDCNDWDDRSPGQEERMYRSRDWTSFALGLPVDPDFSRSRTGQGRFSYCTAGVFLAGQMLERATGERFDTFVGHRILAPLGIRNVQWRRSPDGEVQSGGQLGLRARDAERIGRLVLNGGTWEGRRIVSEAWIAEMLPPVARPGAGLGYGYLWWQAEIRTGASGETVAAAMMIGNGGNIVAVVPELDAVIVVQATNYNVPGDFDMSRALLQRFIVPALADD
jgi:CubicO group peptidase (beta-lactamase class C family)